MVVIGILIALQVNNWNENRKERTTETKVLNEIVSTLKKNNEVVDSRLYWIEEFQHSSKIVMEFLENDIPYSDTLGNHFSRARFSGQDNLSALFSQAGYTELKTSGYDIVRSDSLRMQIVEMFESMVPILTETDFMGSINTTLQD